MTTHKDLLVWKKGINLVKEIYRITASFPREEILGLTSQIRRSVVSIPSNIAEGCGRRSDKELIRFLYTALGSASELETQLIISKELTFLAEKDFRELGSLNNEIIKMLSSLIHSIRERAINL